MTKNKFNYSYFHSENEKKQNEIVAKIVRILVFVGPAFLISNYFHVFSDMSNFKLTILSVFLLIFALSINILCKRHPYSKAIKYVILLCGEALVIGISIDKSFCLFISYALIPLVSCIYFNKKFSIQMTLTAYVLMILIIIYRAIFVASKYPNVTSAMQWGVPYLLGLSIEFFLVALFISLISKKYCGVIEENLNTIASLQKTQDALIESYAALIVQKHDMGFHMEKISQYAKLICTKLRENIDFPELSNEEYVNDFLSAVPIHDIGIIAVPDELLEKKDSLNNDEKKIFEKHTEYGEKLIRENLYTIENREFLKIARDTALYHHERWDGLGYPKGLSNSLIPLSARIMTAADALDSLVGQKNILLEENKVFVISELNTMSGTILDPRIAKVIIDFLESIV